MLRADMVREKELTQITFKLCSVIERVRIGVGGLNSLYGLSKKRQLANETVSVERSIDRRGGVCAESGRLFPLAFGKSSGLRGKGKERGAFSPKEQ